MSDLIEEAMNSPYKSALRQLRQSTTNKFQDYVSDLFPAGWRYADEEIVDRNTQEASSSETDAPSVTEKTKVLDSFHEFAKGALEKSQSGEIKIPGGEIKKKKGTGEFFQDLKANTASVEELIKQSSALSSEFGSLKFAAVPNTPVKAMFIAESSSYLSELDKGQQPLEAFYDSNAATLFSKMIGAMKFQSGDYLVTSIKIDLGKTKDSFTQNLANEIYNLKPQVVFTLGGGVTQSFLGSGHSLQKSHGQFFERSLEGDNGIFNFEIMPLFSPAFLVEAQNSKRIAWEDMQKAMKKLGL